MTTSLAKAKPTMGVLRDVKEDMRIADVWTEGGNYMVFRLNTRILYEPSIFQGDGTEPRRGIVLALLPEEAKNVAAFEKTIRELNSIQPDKWQSCVRDLGASGKALKCKIDLIGPRACKFSDTDGAEAELPEVFKDREVEVAVLVRAFYTQKDVGGLIMDVVAMKLGELKTPKLGADICDVMKAAIAWQSVCGIEYSWLTEWLLG
jgi:hypothetical protein